MLCKTIYFNHNIVFPITGSSTKFNHFSYFQVIHMQPIEVWIARRQAPFGWLRASQCSAIDYSGENGMLDGVIVVK